MDCSRLYGYVSRCSLDAVQADSSHTVGIIAGSHLFGAPSGLHPRDYHLFAQMNSLAYAAGTGEGFLPAGSRGLVSAVEAGAGMLAGRMVPT